jgi:hypothetical protein
LIVATAASPQLADIRSVRRSNRTSLNRAVLHVREGIGYPPVGHVVDLPADKSIDGRGGASEGHKCRLHANSGVEQQTAGVPY